MNQKKTSKKTSLFAPTYSSASVSNENLRIAKPIVLPSTSDQKFEPQPQNDLIQQSDFELKRYYENLNSQFDLNLSDANSQMSQPSRPNQADQTSSGALPGDQQDQRDGQENRKNYSSYINRLTNYFSYSRPATETADDRAAAENSVGDPISPPSLIQPGLLIASDYESSNLTTTTTTFTSITPPLVRNQSNSLLNESNFYQLPKPHWFYKTSKRKDSALGASSNEKAATTIFDEQQDLTTNGADDATVDENWLPFAFHDCEALERAYQSLDSNPNVVVPTCGDRYDCHIRDRFRRSVYWSEEDQEIRRCTWYYKKEGHVRFVPYSEQFAFKLEQIYYDVLMNGKWNQRIELNSSSQEMIIFYSYNSIIHYELDDHLIKDEWNTVNESPVKPKVVNRELTIEELESYEVCLKEDELFKVDHLVFLVHGVGAICDFRLRSIKEVVDDFRRISLELTRTHFRENDGSINKKIGRAEFIPVYWHDLLHGNETGIDQRLKAITLKTVPKLRQFVNDSLLDALFYTSPIYCQHIINTVTDEINRLYSLFITRNPYFRGTVSLSGHSLGSVILFDLLANQNGDDLSPRDESWLSASQNKKMTDSVVYSSRTLSYGQEGIKYPKLKFKTDCFFALGSPISMFLTLRGITQIDEQFCFPNCSNVFNIFHPLDPIAYRIEPMIKREFINLPAVIIPHHRGRKRMHLEIKENLAKISSDIKEKVLFGIKSTWNSVGNLKNFVGMPRSSSNLSEINEQLNSPANQPGDEQDLPDMNSNLIGEESDLYEFPSSSSNCHQAGRTGLLNSGSRIDYVLQEKPIEFFNQYIFALATHACYWTSEDCILFILSKLVSLNKSTNSMDSQSRTDSLENRDWNAKESSQMNLSQGANQETSRERGAQTNQATGQQALNYNSANHQSSEAVQKHPTYDLAGSATALTASGHAFSSPFDTFDSANLNSPQQVNPANLANPQPTNPMNQNSPPQPHRPDSGNQRQLGSPVSSADHTSISTSIDIE